MVHEMPWAFLPSRLKKPFIFSREIKIFTNSEYDIQILDMMAASEGRIE